MLEIYKCMKCIKCMKASNSKELKPVLFSYLFLFFK